MAALLLLPFTASTLVLLLAVAALPSLLLLPDPRFHAEPAADGPGDGLALARTQRGLWIFNGAPLTEQGLARLLQARPRGYGSVRFQPSAGLASGEVASSLAWLRQHTPLPVELESAGVGW